MEATAYVAPKPPAKNSIIVISERNLGRCLVVKVWPFGTMDVEQVSSGLRFRITGLGWLRADGTS